MTKVQQFSFKVAMNVRANNDATICIKNTWEISWCLSSLFSEYLLFCIFLKQISTNYFNNVHFISSHSNQMLPVHICWSTSLHFLVPISSLGDLNGILNQFSEMAALVLSYLPSYAADIPFSVRHFTWFSIIDVRGNIANKVKSLWNPFIFWKWKLAKLGKLCFSHIS